MFDVGFSELVVIGIVALLVLGPKRLPEVARTAGRWMGRLRRLADEVKSDFERELQTQELNELRKLKQDIEQTREILEQPLEPQTHATPTTEGEAAQLPPPDAAAASTESTPKARKKRTTNTGRTRAPKTAASKPKHELDEKS